MIASSPFKHLPNAEEQWSWTEHENHLEGMVTGSWAPPPPGVSDSGSLRQDLRICILSSQVMPVVVGKEQKQKWEKDRSWLMPQFSVGFTYFLI